MGTKRRKKPLKGALEKPTEEGSNMDETNDTNYDKPKRGRPKSIEGYCKQHAFDAVKTAVEVMKSKDATPAQRLEASKLILDRSYGRAITADKVKEDSKGKKKEELSKPFEIVLTTNEDFSKLHEEYIKETASEADSETE